MSISLRDGDASALHRGWTTVIGGNRSSLKLALKKAIASGSFQIKLKLLPDVSAFGIALGTINPLLAAFGVKTRFGSDKTIIKARSKRVNRYLMYMYMRLFLTRGNGNVYWRIALQLLRSHCYLVVSLHHLNKNLYRTKSQLDLLRILKRVNTLRGLLTPGLELNFAGGRHLMLHRVIQYHRTYLPKGSTYRPLGVPTLAWRVYLAMWLIPINGFYPPDKEQHGFVPGRGTLTAWRSLAKNVLPSRNIYEIDFKGFFPSITPPMARRAMSDVGLSRVPSPILGLLESMNWSVPKLGIAHLSEPYLTDASVLHSTWHRNLENLDQLQGYTKSLKELKHLRELRSLSSSMKTAFSLRAIGHLWGNTHRINDIGFRTEMSLSLSKHVNDYVGPVGLPQGSPLSPCLSGLYFKYFLGKLKLAYPSIKWVIYADDVIFHSDDDKEFKKFTKSFAYFCKPYGLTVSGPKSQISKVRGQWIKDRIKFLGIVYEPKDNKIYSETRSGRSLGWTFNKIQSLVLGLSLIRVSDGNTNSRMWLHWLQNQDTAAFSTFQGKLLSQGTYDQKGINKFLMGGAKYFKNFNIWNPESLPRIEHLKGEIDNLNLPIKEIPTSWYDQFSGLFSGLLFSKLYLGTKANPKFDTPSGKQNFKLTQEPGSLGHIMHSRFPKWTNIHNGSSVCTYELVRLSQNQVHPRKDFKLFQGWETFFRN